MDAETEKLTLENRRLRAGIERIGQELGRANQQIVQLTKESGFLRTHTTLAQGMRGETIVVQLTGGTPAARYAEKFDVKVGDNVTVEVKFSKLNTPNHGSELRRWNWSKPLGWKDKGKSFDFLVLVGKRDLRFAKCYPDDSPYVFFVIPRCNVAEVMTKGTTVGGNVQINSNLSSVTTMASLALKKHLVAAEVVTSLVQRKA